MSTRELPMTFWKGQLRLSTDKHEEMYCVIESGAKNATSVKEAE